MGASIMRKIQFLSGWRKVKCKEDLYDDDDDENFIIQFKEKEN